MKQEGFIGAFQNCFINDYGTTSKLLKIPSLRTDGVDCEEEQPRDYMPFLGTTVQSGLVKVTCTINFYGSGDLIYKVSRGVSVSGTINAASGQGRYSILCVYPSITEKRSFWFPDVNIKSAMKIKASKKAPSGISITFEANSISPADVRIYKGSLSELQVIVGSSRWPLLFYT